MIPNHRVIQLIGLNTQSCSYIYPLPLAPQYLADIDLSTRPLSPPLDHLRYTAPKGRVMQGDRRASIISRL